MDPYAYKVKNVIISDMSCEPFADLVPKEVTISSYQKELGKQLVRALTNRTKEMVLYEFVDAGALIFIDIAVADLQVTTRIGSVYSSRIGTFLEKLLACTICFESLEALKPSLKVESPICERCAQLDLLFNLQTVCKCENIEEESACLKCLFEMKEKGGKMIPYTEEDGSRITSFTYNSEKCEKCS